MKVNEVMIKNMVTVSATAIASDAAKKMLSENVGTVLVTEKALMHVCGIYSAKLQKLRDRIEQEVNHED